MTVQGSQDEVGALRELQEAAQEVVRTTQYLRVVGGQNLTRNTLAVVRLQRALEAVQGFSWSVRRPPPRKGKHGSQR